MFKKGDILLPLNRVARIDWLHGLFHPAVVWDDFNDNQSDFQGILLTHTKPKGYFENILMSPNHFENGYEAVYSNTHFVNQLFIKFSEWSAFELVGRLTLEGIELIENQLNTNSYPIEFIQFRQLVNR